MRRQPPVDSPYENSAHFRKDELYESGDWIRGRGRRGGGHRGDYGRWMQRPFFHSGQEHASFHRSSASDDRTVKIAIGLPSSSEDSPEYSKSSSAIQRARMIRLLTSTYIPEVEHFFSPHDMQPKGLLWLVFMAPDCFHSRT